MATTIDWYGGDGSNEILPAESGEFDTLGFFGAAYGFSIRVGEYNQTTRVTNDNGTAQNGQIPNVRYLSATGAYVASELVGREVQNIDNDEATLRIRLFTDSAVETQNTAFRAFDRVSIENAPSGVTVLAAEIRNPPGTATASSGDSSWTTIAGATDLSLDNHSTGPLSTHEWYIAVTVSPTSIGEKTDLGFYFETEFL